MFPRSVLRAALLVLGAGLSCAAAAREPTDAEIERLLVAARAQQMVEAIVPQVEAAQREQFAQITQGKALTPEQQQQIATIQQRTTDIVRQSLAWEAIKPLYLQVYRQTFDDDQIKAMTRFYESPAGQAMLDKTPAMTQALMAGMQQQMVPKLESLQAELKNISEEPAMPAPPVSPPEPRRAQPAHAGKTKAKAKSTGKSKSKKTPAKKTTKTSKTTKASKAKT
ncbi:MAG: DUF2059 domain-containing protein [Pseudoxanthomonas sp.]